MEVTRTQLCSSFLEVIPRFMNGTITACDNNNNTDNWSIVANHLIERAVCVCPVFVDQLNESIYNRFKECSSTPQPNLECQTDTLTDFHACFYGVESCTRPNESIGSLQHYANCYNDYNSNDSFTCSSDLTFVLDVGTNRTISEDIPREPDQTQEPSAEVTQPSFAKMSIPLTFLLLIHLIL